MNLNYHHERDFSNKELNYQYLNPYPFNYVKRQRFHYKGRPKNNFVHEVVEIKNQNIYDNDDGLRRINSNKNEFTFSKEIHLIHENKYYYRNNDNYNYKYNSVDMKSDNINNNNYKNYKMYYNYNVNNDFYENEENEINKKYNYNQNKKANDIKNRNEIRLCKQKYIYSKEINSDERNEKYNVNNDKHQYNIDKQNKEDYSKKMQINQKKNNEQSNKIYEQRQDIRNVVLKEVDNKYINSPKKNYNYIQKSQSYQIFNCDKNSKNNNNNHKIDFNYYQNRINNLKSIQYNNNDKPNKKLQSNLSNHSFKYINQSKEKNENKNKSINENYDYNNNRISSARNLTNSNKNNIVYMNKYVNENVTNPIEKNNINKNNQINNSVKEIRIIFENKNYNYDNTNYKPICNQDNQTNKTNNQKYRNNSALTGIKFETDRNTVNINSKYKEFLKNEVGKNIRNSINNIYEIRSSKNMNNEYKDNYNNNFSYKIMKNEDKNENNSKYAVKAKVVKKNDNKNVSFKIFNEPQKNEYNNNNIKKHISYNNVRTQLDENKPNKNDELSLKYNNNKEYQRPSSEKKHQQNQNINYHQEIYRNENQYDYKRNNPPIKNVLKDYNSKDIKKKLITINYNLNDYKNNKVYQEPILSKYSKEFEIMNVNKKVYNTIEVNDSQRQQLNQNSSRNQNSYIENKTKNIMKNYGIKANLPANNNSKLIIEQKAIDIKNKPIINNNIQYKYVKEVKDSNITNKVISPIKEKRKNENMPVNNNIYKTNLNNQAFNKNNINNANTQLNKNNIGKNNYNNQINEQKRVFSPPPTQNVKIRNQLFNNNVLNSNSKKYNQNITYNNNKNFVANNNTNNTNNNSNNINKINYNINYNYSFTNNNINQKDDFNSNINNNNSQYFKNNIKEVVSIKSNNSFVMNKFQNNNNDSYNINNKNDSHNKNLSPSFRYNNFNIRLSKNLIMPKHLNYDDQNQLMKNKSSPNLRVRNKAEIKKKYANGLQNIGANCYMNAILQCLAHVQSLTIYLLERSNEIKSKKYSDKLAFSYLELLENLWKNNSIKNYAPYNFKEIISTMNPLFKGIQANDSKELIVFLLENLHNELNKAKNIYKSYDEKVDKYNFYNSLNNYTKYFKNNYNSIISGIFYGINNLQKKCLKCDLITHNIQFYNILNIPIEEIRIFKKNQQDAITIKDCFEYNQRSKHIIGQNKIFCDKCKQMEESASFTSLITGPKVLIINLNRGKGLQFDVKLDLDEIIDINEFIYFKNTPNKYQLIGVVTHFGQPGKSGHYIAICKSFVDNNWYKYDDSIVTLSNFQEAKTLGIPCVLFYSALAN